MNRFDKFALAAVIVATLLCAQDTLNSAHLYIEMYPISGAMLLTGIAGWVIATYGPIAVSALFWHLAKRLRAAWVLHIIFLPCAVALFRTGESLMLFVIGDPDFDASLGGPVIAAMLLFVIAVGGYYVAVVSRHFFTPSNQA